MILFISDVLEKLLLKTYYTPFSNIHAINLTTVCMIRVQKEF